MRYLVVGVYTDVIDGDGLQRFAESVEAETVAEAEESAREIGGDTLAIAAVFDECMELADV